MAMGPRVTYMNPDEQYWGKKDNKKKPKGKGFMDKQGGKLTCPYVNSRYIRMGPDLLNPRKTPIRDHQLRDAQRVDASILYEFIKRWGSALIGSEVGTGKTCQALQVIQTFMDLRYVLIVAEHALHDQWLAEAEYWLNGIEG